MNSIVAVNYISHPLLKEGAIESRIYQQKIFNKAIDNNIIVMLPARMGKTTIATLVISYYLHKYSAAEGCFKTKCIFLTPTRPLVLRRTAMLQDKLTISQKVAFIMGSIATDRRQKLFQRSNVLIMTPQVLLSDLENEFYDLRNVSVIVFDECHRATGDYAYVKVAALYQQQNRNGRLLGLTTSLGAKHIADEVRDNLKVASIESSVDRYTTVKTPQPPKKIEWRMISLPQIFQEMRDIVERSLFVIVDSLRKRGIIQDDDDPRFITIPQLVDLQNEYQEKLRRAQKRFNKQLMQGLKLVIANISSCIRLLHLIERIETQGLSAANQFLNNLKEQARKSSKEIMLRRFCNLQSIKKVEKLIERGLNQGYEHPKVFEVIAIAKQQLITNPESRVLIFANTRTSVRLLVEKLNQLNHLPEVSQHSVISASALVGHKHKRSTGGLTPKQQTELLKKFEGGRINVIVATSAAEQGLDIIDCDLVVFYDCVPDLLRVHQRRSKTGIKHRGRVIILVTKGTKDERYYWVAKAQEKKLKQDITYWT